ncbi:MAG TPA: VIT and VWA domain-containing protein [Bryobacteraceae bacterium]|nr:VIT and VWA domain-containing protein [Bryobacteraceae bacterium]
MAVVSQPTGFAAVAARTGEELQLAMQRLWLTGRILPAGARLMVTHTFRSSEAEPVEVVYAFALPRDAALRRFRVRGPGFSVRSELKPVSEAVKWYEEGIEAGSLSALARQYGDGLINLMLGNLRPQETVTVALEILAGVELRDDGLRFRFPFTLAPSYHRRARAIEAEPGMGELELPEDEFGDLLLPQYAEHATALHEVGFRLSVWMAGEIAEVRSPSHAVHVVPEEARRSRVTLAPAHDVPDRDLVLDVRTKQPAATALAGTGTDGKRHFAAILPSKIFGEPQDSPRRIVLVLDRSSSMSGTPMRQARRAAKACLAALRPQDSFGIVAFDDEVALFRDALATGDDASRDAAREFLDGIEARGGTELALGIRAAAELLAGPGDVVVLTDGQVFGTEEILAAARPLGIRLHCLGIGSASQDRFLALLARETGGVSRFVTPRERVDVSALELFASISRPVAEGLRVRCEGLKVHLEPEPPRAVFAGNPVIVWGEMQATGSGRLAVTWNGGATELALEILDDALGETLRLLRGARLITDYDCRIGSNPREQRRLEDKIETLSRCYGLASRQMALVAVVERPDDQPGEVPKTIVVPVGMPQDVPFGSYFGESVLAFKCEQPPARLYRAAMPHRELGEVPARRVSRRARFEAELPEADAGDELIELAARLQADGGMPGRDEEERLRESLAALLKLVAAGHSLLGGALRPHVARLVAFLESLAVPPAYEALVAAAIAAARQERAVQSPRDSSWEAIEAAVA